MLISGHSRCVCLLVVSAAMVAGCGVHEASTNGEPMVGSSGSYAGNSARGDGGTSAGRAESGAGQPGVSTSAGATGGAAGGAATPPSAGTGAAPMAGQNAGQGAAAGSGGRIGAGASGAGGATVTEAGAKPGHACDSAVSWGPQPSDLWIAPSGDDASPGTEANPKKTLAAAIGAWSAGKTIWVAPGTYDHAAPIDLSIKATADGPLRISGVTGGAKPVFDFSREPRASSNGGQRGFELSGSYVHLRYLELQKAADNCLYVTGSNNTLEWLTVHECQDTGIQLSNGAASNKVLNVDSYLNADPSGENADGFAPKLSIGQNNYFCGTRAYQNADDGYDCWASGDSSPVKFEYCWAFDQPGPTATANGDGNGFKLGSPTSRASGGNAAHELIDCFAFHNRGAGFTANGNNSGMITCKNCGAWGNGTPWSTGSGGALPQHTGDITNLNVESAEAMKAPRDERGNLPDITTL